MHALVLHSLIFALLSCVLTSYPLLCAEHDTLYDFTFKQVILPNSAVNDTYDIHRKFAVLNTAYNRIIEEYYRPEKKRIERLMQERNISAILQQVSWNKNFSVCACVMIKKSITSKSERSLECMLMWHADRQLWKKKSVWPACMFLAAGDKAQPMFNEKGYANIIMYANFALTPDLHIIYNGFLKYSIDVNGNQKAKRCLIEAGRGGKFFEFNCLVNLPQLLRACLLSTKVSQRQLEEDGDKVILYHIKGVTIPEDYKAFEKHPVFGFVNHSSYDELPAFLKDAIEKRRKKQQQSKKIMFNKK